MKAGRRQIALIASRGLGAFLVALACLGCAPEEPVRIGFLGGISGRWADLGNLGRDGVQLAVEQRNLNGGVRGRPVELLIRDDRQEPESARAAMNELIAHGSVAIVGPMTSSMTAEVKPIAERAGVPMVAPTVTSETFSGRDDLFFRVTPSTRAFASLSARFLHGKTGLRRVAAAYLLNNEIYTKDWLDRFQEAFEAEGGQVVTAIPFLSDGATTYQDIARRLLSARPDGILIVANSTDSALLCHRIRTLDARIPLSLSDWGGTERLVELGGKAVEGVTAVQTFNRESRSPRYLAFQRAFQARFQRNPGAAGMYAYEAANVVLDALEHRQNGQQLKQVLLHMGRVEGLQTAFQFGAFGDVKRDMATMNVVRNGEFHVIK